jgi:hypothetical protein
MAGLVGLEDVYSGWSVGEDRPIRMVQAILDLEINPIDRQA